MSLTATYFAVIHCDCGNSYGPRLDAPNATELRGSAYGEGWRFPNREGVKGAMPRRTDDVCPVCAKSA